MKVETSFAAQIYDLARRVAPAEQAPARPAGTAAPDAGFSEALARAVSEFGETLGAGEAAARHAMAGQADVQSVVEALTATELALETAVTVRDRVVEAYQEILRMPI